MATGSRLPPSTINLYYCENVQIGSNNVINYQRSRTNSDTDNDGYDLEEDGSRSSIRPPSIPQSSTTFVGRIQEIETIKNFVRCEQDKGILQINGSTMVGKKALVKQALSVVYNDEPSTRRRPVISIPCSRVTSWKDFLNTFASFCNIKIVVDKVTEISYIVSFKDKIDKHKPILIFTNCEMLNLTKPTCGKHFQNFVKDLLENCQFTQIILTSQQFFDFDGISQDIQLSKFSDKDTFDYLEKLLPEQDIEKYHEVIKDRCYGLPTYIRDAAFLIRDNLNVNPLTAEELKALLEDDFRSSRLRDDTETPTDLTLSQYIACVPPKFHQDAIDMSILKGRFGLEAVQAVLGKSSGVVKYTVGALCKNSVLDQVVPGDNGDLSTMFSFRPEIAGTLNHLVPTHIRYNDVARLRFVNYFGHILLQINSNLYLPSRQSMYGYDPMNWLHLQNLLREAVHCSHSTFEAFKEVALKADNIIINCFPNESIEFYELLESIAERIGTPKDIAALKAQLARALTVNQGVDLKRPRKLFLEAAEILKDYGASSALICLRRDLAFNYFKDAQYKEAARNCEEAIELGRKVETLDNMMISRILSARSLAAINYNILGDHKKAEDIILETLELAKQFSTSHASIYVMLNTLGIINENINKDDDEALKYYKASLHERRKYEEIVPQELIISLNYVGMQYAKREEYEKGLNYLEEAVDICKRCKICDEKAGLTYNNLGTVNLKLKKYELALEQLRESVKI